MFDHNFHERRTLQGWRLEVKQFPKLTEFGAWRGPRGRQYGGFYTQEEVSFLITFESFQRYKAPRMTRAQGDLAAEAL